MTDNGLSERPAVNAGRFLLRSVGLAVAVVYVLWNVWWLAWQQLPPALFKGLTGLPAPTTGCTRSVRALIAGDPGLSLAYNPFTLPMLGLLAYTVVALVWRRKLHGQALLYAWVAVLGLAWIAKLMSPTWTW